MKTLILTSLSFLLTCYLYGQNFSKDYFEHCRPKWEKQATEEEKKSVNHFTDSLMFAMTGKHVWELNIQEEKENTINNLLRFKNIMQLKGIEIDTLNNFILIEESNLDEDGELVTIKNGIVLFKDKYFSYNYDLVDSNSLMLTNDFLEKYDSINKENPRSILFHLAKQNKTDQISILAVKEMNSIIPSEFQPKKQFEVLIYNVKSDKKISLCYLHEMLVDSYEK